MTLSKVNSTKAIPIQVNWYQAESDRTFSSRRNFKPQATEGKMKTKPPVAFPYELLPQSQLPEAPEPNWNILLSKLRYKVAVEGALPSD